MTKTNEGCLQGENILLCPICEDDTDLIVSWRNKEKVRSNFIFKQDFTRQIHLEWLENMVYTGKVAQFIIYDKHDIPIGSTFLRDIDMANKKAEFGIFIGEDEARGHGYGTEAAKLIINFGFHDLKLHKIMLRVFADNLMAINAYKRAGFELEGHLKDEIKTEQGYRDLILMSIIQEG